MPFVYSEEDKVWEIENPTEAEEKAIAHLAQRYLQQQFGAAVAEAIVRKAAEHLSIGTDAFAIIGPAGNA